MAKQNRLAKKKALKPNMNGKDKRK
jgi:hypothetical protein